MRKYSFQRKFQLFLFFIATAVQLFLIFKYDPGNIISNFMATKVQKQIFMFVITVPFMAIPILIISMTVVDIIDNIVFFKKKKDFQKEMKKYLRSGEEKILKKNKIKLHIRIINYFKYLHNNTIVLDGIVLFIILTFISLIASD